MKQIISSMALTKLKQVPMLQRMDEVVLKEICQHLKPMKYIKNDIIIQEDEPLKMLLIVDGLVTIEKRESSNELQRGAGDLYGETLLSWPFSTSFPNVVPFATESAKAIGDVEALVLIASNLESVVSKFKRQYFFEYGRFKEKIGNHPGFVGTMPRIFTSEELEKATNNYHASRCIGEGVYATVYKGVLPDETMIAVKKSISPHAVNEEIAASHNNQCNHINLVRLLGCCLEPRTPTLVFEYISNGNLHEHIHRKDSKGSSSLSLELRMKIAVETARALAYLHSLTPMAIIHRDVKASNILLDDDYTVKLFGFGVSQLVPEGEYQLKTLVQETIGYLGPDYFQTGILTKKTNVFSFGVVLAELLTSQRILNRKKKLEEINLARIFSSSMRKNRFNLILDSDIITEENFGTAKKVANLANRCLSLKGEERPSMVEVAEELEGLRSIIMSKHSVVGPPATKPRQVRP